MRRHRKEHTSGGQDKGDNCGSSLLRKRKRSEKNYRGNSMCKGQGGVSPSLEEAKEGRRKKLQEMWLEKGGVGAQAGSLQTKTMKRRWPRVRPDTGPAKGRGVGF